MSAAVRLKRERVDDDKVTNCGRVIAARAFIINCPPKATSTCLNIVLRQDLIANFKKRLESLDDQVQVQPLVNIVKIAMASDEESTLCEQILMA